MTSANSQPPTLVRDRILVSIGAIVWVAGTLVGMGIVGGPGVEQQGEGLFSDAATLIAPHGPAFSIWPVIYLCLAAYIVWQWLPASSASRWAGVTRVPAAASLALNGLWLFSVFAGWIFVSVLVMLGIVVSLGLILRATAKLPAGSAAEQAIVGVTFGLYLGWICVATCANIASWLVSLGVARDGALATVLTVVVLAVVIVLAALLLRRARHRIFQLAFAAAIIWGVAWVAVGRFVGELANSTIGAAALVAAAAVAVLAALHLLRVRAVTGELPRRAS